MSRFISLLLLGLTAFALLAENPDRILLDSLESNPKVLYIGRGDTLDIAEVRRRINNFYVDQFRHFQDPRAPYFLLMSKDADLAMGIGGMVRMRGYYDWNGAIPARGFIPYLIQVTPDPTNVRNIGCTPAGTALFFKVIGSNTRVGNYQLYIEANFSGYGERDFKLKRSYATINDWTIGYDISTFSDLMSLPPTIDSQGPNAELMNTRVLLRWMHSWTRTKQLTTALSLEFPEANIGAEGDTRRVSLWLPDVAAFAQWQWDQGMQHVRLAGILRTLPYRDMLMGVNRNILGWGVQLSGSWRPFDPLNFTFAVNTGRGYESLTKDLMIDPVDLINDPGRPGYMYAPWAIGWYASLRYSFRPNIYATLVAGQVHFMPRTPMPGDTYKYGTYCVANIFWDMTKRIQVGAELNVGRRDNRDGEHRTAQRVGLLAQFAF